MRSIVVGGRVGGGGGEVEGRDANARHTKKGRKGGILSLSSLFSILAALLYPPSHAYRICLEGGAKRKLETRGELSFRLFALLCPAFDPPAFSRLSIGKYTV